MTNGQARGPQQQPEPQLEGMAARERPWQVQVDVYVESDDDPENPKFRIESSLPSRNLKSGEKCLIFENNCRPGFTILFHLHDKTANGGYAFPSDADNAVWSKIGDKCPDEQWARNEVFEPLRVIDNGKTLVVYNKNDKRDGKPIDRFWYTLRVVRAGSPPLLIDPPGDNMNGQSS